jgi:hypothetical protein
MGGAFVAVADDSSATWWNPAALADGPFFDLSIEHGVDERGDSRPAGRDSVTGVALSLPMVGVSFRRVGVAGVGEVLPVVLVPGGRQDGEASTGLRRWSGSIVGGTLVQTLFDGVHVGATLKYLRGTARQETAIPAVGIDDGLERAAGLEGGQAENRFDLDVGGLAVVGPVRLGAVVRNVRAPTFQAGQFQLPRQARIGAALAFDRLGGPPMVVSADVDVLEYRGASGPRRVVAVGAERWFLARRFAVRGGGRINRAGARERSLTAGASVALRSGMYLEAHVVGGSTPAERGWGTGIRVSF